MKKRLFYYGAILTLTTIIGCLPINNRDLSTVNKNSSVIQIKPNPYYGDVDIKIDTSLKNLIDSQTDVKSRKFVLTSDNSFKTESINLPEIPYTKSFKIESQEKEAISSFNISDITKKYYILATKLRKEDKLDININGITQISSSTPEINDYFISKPVILEQNNTIKVKYSGITNDLIFVTLVEGSKIDTVRKRIDNIKWKEITENVNSNNLYNPNELTVSGLLPYQGDKTVDNSNGSSYSIGVSSANNTIAIFKSGYVAVTLREPVQTNLQLLLQRTKANKESLKNFSGSNIAVLKINYEQTDITKLMGNLKSLNTFSQAPIKTASFSSINSAKTISTLIDLLVNNSDLISNAGLIEFMNQSGSSYSNSPDSSGNIVSDENQKTGSFDFYENTTNYNDNYQGDTQNNLAQPAKKSIPVPTKSTEQWWLKDTNITKAWRYSLGKNTKIGIFDVGFGDKLNGIKSLEYALSIPYSDGPTQRPNIDSDIFKAKLEFLDCPSFYEYSNETGCGSSTFPGYLGHGFWIASLINSDIDNKKGIAGVSPRAKLSLFTYDKGGSGIYSLMDTLNRHKNDIQNISSGLDVINISSGVELSLYEFQNTDHNSDCANKNLMYKPNFESTGLYLCGTIPVRTAKDILELSNMKKYSDGSINPEYSSSKKSTIFVVSAGNQNKEASTAKNKFFFPGSFSNVINVGAYELKNIDSGDRIRGDFFPKKFEKDGSSLGYDAQDLSSNYGSVDIWAPGDNILIDIGNSDNNSPSWNSIKGTSFASPIVAGVISLLKSIKPDLDINEARTILQDSGNTLTDSSFKNSIGQKSINAEQAIKDLILKTGQYKDKLFESITETYSNAGTLKNDRGFIHSFSPKSNNFYSDLIGKEVIALIFPGDEVLQMREKIQPIAYQNQSTFVVQSYAKEPVVGGDKIAIPVTEELKQKLRNDILVLAGGTKLSLLDRVQDYAIYGVDKNIPDGIQDIIAKKLSTGETVLSFEQALYKTALAIGLKPVNSVTFPDGTTLTPQQFITNNTKLQVKSTDTVGVSLRGDLANITISLGGKTATLQSIVDNYVAFKIPPDVAPGVQDVIIKYAGGNITFSQALEVLASNPDVAKNNKIAISGNRYSNNYNTQIYTLNPTSTEIVQVSTVYGYSLSWSPDKSKIAYGGLDNSNYYNIYMMNDDGSNKTQITFGNSDDYPIWSNDGKKILYLSYLSNGDYLCIVNVDGTNSNNPVKFNISNYRAYTEEMSWSQDNSKIAFNSNNNIYVLDINTGNIAQITASNQASFPDWTRDNKLVYIDNNEIIKVNPDGSNREVIYTSTDGSIDQLSTPLNGSKIAWSESNSYIQDNSFKYLNDIYTVDIDGTNKTNATNNLPTDDYISIQNFSWAANGSEILYKLRSYYPNYQTDFFTVNINGSNKAKLNINFDYSYYSKWSTKNYKDNKEDRKLQRISW